MTPHSIIQYLQYRWRAMGRHGIHSPFVYDLIEQVLQDRGKRYTDGRVQEQFLWLGEKYGRLATRIAMHYDYKKILCLQGDEQTSGHHDFVLLSSGAFSAWQQTVARYIPQLHNGAILIQGIHCTAGHTAVWQAICRRPDVIMSMDLYGVGLLFFKGEFREKQHFVLRAPLKTKRA